MTIHIGPAGRAHLDPIRELLAKADLPVNDLTPAKIDSFLIATDDEDEVVGAIGLEACGTAGLLRSLVVRESSRRTGLGGRLVRRLETRAGELGIRELYLLTTTAASFFDNLGYQRVPRGVAPTPIAETTEFKSLCPDSAVCQRKPLTPTRDEGEATGIAALGRELGRMDIYLIDQMLRGRIREGMTVLDCGCGGGRNIDYFLRAGLDVLAADINPSSVETVAALAETVAPRLPRENFRAEPVEAMSFPEHCADVVINCAVLHFADDDDHFERMLGGSWRVVRPGGMLFCRLASSIGIESLIKPLGGRRFTLPDGSARYLVDEEMLVQTTKALGGELLDPIKTTIVQSQRSMTTWVVSKPA